ncbi:MAG: TMEM165/GDT1 family protein [Nitrososphaerota archaeon]|nr:TMEM165/GDT1 family protein [Nitrososphaerota archaeon]
MDLNPLLASFLLITLAELGDKTQLAIISLSSCSNAFVVLVGATTAFIIVSAIGVAVGDSLSMFIPPQVMNFSSAILFLVFGTRMILTRNKEECFRETDSKYAFLSVLSMVMLMELGDKTQIAVIALAAKYSVPIMVYTGVIMAFIFLTIMSIFLGRALSKWLSVKFIKLGSGIVFLLFGVFLLLECLNINFI